MRGVVVRGGAPALEEVPRPELGAGGDVLIRVEVSAWNGLDAVRMRTGADLPPGIECSGTVVAVGDRVRDLAPGDPVIGLVGSGALSEFVVAPRETLLRRPGWMPAEVAGGVTEMFAIAMDAVEQLAVTPGELAVVRGANGGIGNGIVQLLRARGVRSVGIVREIRPTLPQADETVSGGGSPEVRPDALFECVGPGFLDRDVEMLAENGRILLLGALGQLTASLDFLRFMQKRVRLVGSTFSPRPLREQALLLSALEREVLPLLRSGALRVPVDSVFDVTACAASFARFVSGDATGKVLVRF